MLRFAVYIRLMYLWHLLDRKLRELEELYAEREHGAPSPVRLVKLVRHWYELRRLIWAEGGRELLSCNQHLAGRFLTLKRNHSLSVIAKPWGSYVAF